MRLPRAAPVVLLALLLPAALPALAQATQTQVTLTVDVQPDHAERHTLRFEGLKRLTEYQDICLPARATPTSVTDELGEVPHARKTEGDRVSLTFRARSESVTIEMTRPGPSDEHAPFYEANANFCVPESSRTTARVRVPEGHELFFVSRGGAIDDARREATLTKDGPLHVFYSYEAPLDPASGLARVDAAPFHLVVPADRADEAREVSRVAAPALRAAASEAGLSLPWDRLRVRYAPTSEFTWEAGHYGGHGLITVRESSLDPDPRQGYPYTPARVLVHEAFHAISVPYGRGDVTDVLDWWLEGAARHAERHVDAVLPNGSRHCEKGDREVRCWSFDDRISPADLEQAYRPGFAFEKRWTPSLEQSDDTRGFYYQLSAYLVGAYVQMHGQDAYRAAWDALGAAFADDARCPCGTGWLEGVLLEAAGEDATVRDLYRPYGSVYDVQPTVFHARVQPLVKDETALQDELDRQTAGGFGGFQVPSPALPLLLLALCLAALAARRRDG